MGFPWARAILATSRVLGHTEDPRKVITELETGRENLEPCLADRPGPILAWVRASAGLEWLETALGEGDPYSGSLMVFPGYDQICDQPRFRHLVRELRLPT
jgi:hypothetical protein